MSSPFSAMVPPLEISLEEYKDLQAQVSELSFEDACFELLDCSRFGELDAVRAILESHPSCIDHEEKTNTALHKASANGHVKVVQLLLQHDAKLLSNDSGNTALHWAAANGHHEVVAVLLKHFNNDIDVLRKNSFGRSALTEGFGSKSTETAKLLLEHDSASEDKLLAGGKEIEENDKDRSSKDEKAKEKKQNSIIHEFCFGSSNCHVKIQELPIAITAENNPLGETAIDDTTGLGIWCASLVMAQWMADLSCFKNKTVVELGAGCGVPGLTIAAASIPAEHVYVTDLNPTTVKNLQDNIEINNLQEKVTAMTIDWDDPSTWPLTTSSEEKKDLHSDQNNIAVIGSDLIYQQSIVPLLKQVVLGLLLEGGSFYYVAPDTGRDGLDEFINDIQHAGMRLVSKKAAPPSYHQNPLQSKDEEEAFLHFHELTSSTYILYEFCKE